ncbi:MAG: EAL domain-containing protein [Thalassolituus sp.]
MLIKSIRTAVMLLSLISIALVATSVLYSALREHRELYSRYVESDLRALSENMANDLVGILAKGDHFFELKRYLLSLEPYENVVGAAVYDPDWNVLEVYAGKVMLDPDSEVQHDFAKWGLRTDGIHREHGELSAVRQIGEAPLVMGHLVLIIDLQGPLKTSTWNLALRILPVAIAVILIMVGLFYVQASRWLWPLTQLSEFARKVQDTKDYTLKIPVYGKYEVSSLTTDINNMMDAIRIESDINQEYVELLEQRREEMEYLANYDSLTRLLNRQSFMGMLDHALKECRHEGTGDLAVMFVDLDGFKEVNDTLGHEVGDKLLVEVATRLKSYVPLEDIVCRHGGDEFLIMCRNPGQGLEDLAGEIVSGLKTIFLIDSWEVRISASVGIAWASESGFDTQDTIRNADVAMYAAKKEGKSRYSFFRRNMLIEHQRKIDIANAIEPGIERDEFMICYQPKVDGDGRPKGVEALVRWQSEALGVVSPADFIPIAERSGKISVLTDWVVERVCRDVAAYFQTLPEPVLVSVNLSAFDLKRYQFSDYIRETFSRYGIRPELIEFEVTEHAYLDNFDMANRFFTDVADMGCRVALDDFGTGYSSLSYLTRIPIDLIKIDKEFVENIGVTPRDDALVLTVIEMSKRLGIELCAEGVENQSQRNFLKMHGCNLMQGYLFSRPLTVEELPAYFAREELA